MKKIVAVMTVLLICALALCACTPNAEKLEKKFEKEGYVAGAANFGDLGDLEVEYKFYAVKGFTSSISVVCFKKSSDATDYYNKLNEKTTNKKTIAKKGNAVAWGSEEAIKIFK